MSPYGCFLSYGLTVILMLFLQAEWKDPKCKYCVVMLEMQISKSSAASSVCLSCLELSYRYQNQESLPYQNILSSSTPVFQHWTSGLYRCLLLIAFIFPFFQEKNKSFVLPSQRASRIPLCWHVFWAEWSYRYFLVGIIVCDIPSPYLDKLDSYQNASLEKKLVLSLQLLWSQFTICCSIRFG